MNCKPGDLAILIYGDFPENIGKICRVIRRSPPEYQGEEPFWECKFDRPIRGEDEDGLDSYSRFNACSDSQLRPIRPGDISDEEVRDLYAPKIPEAA